MRGIAIVVFEVSFVRPLRGFICMSLSIFILSRLSSNRDDSTCRDVVAVASVGSTVRALHVIEP